MFESYPRYEHAVAAWQLALAMFGMGLLLAPRDFAAVVRTPRALLVGFAIQLVGVPLLASALGRVLAPPAGIAAGLVLVAAVPGGTLSNLVTFFARGNVPLSISLTAVTTLGALGTTPLLLGLLAPAHLPAGVAMPVGRVAFEIAATLLAPLAAGMAIGARLPERRQALSRWSVRASLALIGLIALGAGASGRLDPRAYGAEGLLAVGAFALLVPALAAALAALARVAPPDATALVVEATVRNANLAVLVKASLFPAAAHGVDPIGDGMLFVALLYAGAALAGAVPLVWLGRRRAAARAP